MVRSATSEHWAKPRLQKNAGDFFALVALDFNAAVFHSSPRAAGFLHFSGERFFLRKANADEIFNHGDGLSTTPGGLPNNVDTPTVLRWLRTRIRAGGVGHSVTF